MFVTTSNGYINADQISLIEVRSREKRLNSLPAVDVVLWLTGQEAPHSVLMYQGEVDRLLSRGKVVPAQEGFERLAYVKVSNPDGDDYWMVEREPVLAWKIMDQQAAEPICQNPQWGRDTLTAVKAPDGRVRMPHECDFANEEQWVSYVQEEVRRTSETEEHSSHH